MDGEKKEKGGEADEEEKEGNVRLLEGVRGENTERSC